MNIILSLRGTSGSGKTTIVSSNVRIHPRKLNQEHIGDNFEIEGRYKGDIAAILDEENLIISIEDDEDDEIIHNKHYRIETTKQKHYAFNAF